MYSNNCYSPCMDVMIAIIAVWPIASVVIGTIDFPQS